MSYTDITCPKCFSKHDADQLEQNTEYQCWSSDQVSVECPSCSFEFNVRCEHAGYNAMEDFDMNSFRRAYKITYAEGSSRIFTDHYLQELIESGTTKLVQDENDRYQHNKQWAEAHTHALAIWKDIQTQRGLGEDEQDEEG